MTKSFSQAAALARKAARNPHAAAVALYRTLNADWPRLALGDPDPAAAWAGARDELRGLGLLETFEQELRAAFAPLAGQEIRGKRVVAGGVKAGHAEMLWAIVRRRRPRLVVETGVCNGLSSAIILEALAANASGRLVSLDLAEFSDPALNDIEVWEGKGGAVIPAGKPVGWLVPEDKRVDWRLELGRSQDLLIPLLAELGPVDVFIHDSEHSYDNQLFEFREGFAALAPGGLLIATDINWSSAFDDFWAATARQAGARRAFVDHSCAVVAKP